MQPRVFYEIFVRSFADSDSDGIGDLKGITSKLDYLAELGIDGLWLTPIFHSPSYHKYDVKDYYRINGSYGTEEDLKELLDAAHERGIKVILDLVLNHTSSSHHWFREAATNPASKYREYYYWLTPKVIQEKGVAERRATDDSGVKFPWHWPRQRSKEKYFGMFWKEMPDLNLNSQALQNELITMAKFWLGKGVDGFRLDAAKHLFPFWEPQSKTLEFWSTFKNALEADFPEVYLVGEVWDAPEVVAPYFESLQANFNIDLSYDLKTILKEGKDSVGLISKLKQAHVQYEEVNPYFMDCTLLSNHDQDRISSVLKGDEKKLKVAANLLFTLPGLPYLYYGEEWGLKGLKPDEYLREPMPWGDDSQTRWIDQRHNKRFDHKQATADPDSIFQHYKRLIALRKSIPALAQCIGSNLEEVENENTNLLIFKRMHETGDVLVIQNLSARPFKVNKLRGFDHLIFETEQTTVLANAYHIPAFGLLIVGNQL
ncbi:alpha-amylase family glycosyl hydrolase [Jiulongibacter sediminis]|uniref:alpha-amylase family glycosyl hydrolase n=1 Tax=Jiulongibacter sediminis TaxID=1605367 RepID=UPI0026F1BB8C|nr:alpha-amylase family glycosyl hydrolase [Jiulongibacter sediminis]